MQNVIQRYYSTELSDEELLDAIDDAVDEWHDGKGNELELWEYIGLCKPEYKLWVQSPDRFLNQMKYQKNAPACWCADD